MKATIYTALALLVAGGIVYMVYNAQQQQKVEVIPTGDFATDDQLLYNTVRAQLQSYEMAKNKDPLSWFDDMVAENYNTSLINGVPSKTAAYVLTLKQINPTHPLNRKFGQLLKNLQTRYQ